MTAIRKHQRVVLVIAVACASAAMFATVGCRKKAQTAANEAKSALVPPVSVSGDVATPETVVMQAQTPTTIVVEVEGMQLTRADLDARVESAFARMGPNVPLEYRLRGQAEIEKRVIEEFVAETVLKGEAVARKIVVEEQEVTEFLASLKAQVKDEAEYNDLVRRNGPTEDGLRKRISENMMINKMLEAHTANVPVPTDEEVKAFYDTEKQRFERPEMAMVRHILVAFAKTDEQSAKDQKKQTAEDLRKQLVEGADFAVVAAEHSDDPISKVEGGKLGEVYRGQTVKAFEDAVFSQPIGEIGPVVETEYGFHIVQVLERKDAYMQPLEEASSNIVRYLSAQKRAPLVRDFINALKSKANVKYATMPQEQVEELTMPQ